MATTVFEPRFCLIHFDSCNDNNETLTLLSEVRLATLNNLLPQWLLTIKYPEKAVASAALEQLNEKKTEEGSEEPPTSSSSQQLKEYFYHEQCYTRITNRYKLERALDAAKKKRNKN